MREAQRASYPCVPLNRWRQAPRGRRIGLAGAVIVGESDTATAKCGRDRALVLWATRPTSGTRSCEQ
jgi:hypothetical protein